MLVFIPIADAIGMGACVKHSKTSVSLSGYYYPLNLNSRQCERPIVYCLDLGKIMKIFVLGAGVVGVTTAYALACLGHEVCVIEKAEDVAMGASEANGGQLSFSYTDPLASPATLRKIPAFLLGLDPAARIGFSANPAFIFWGLSFLRNCLPDRFNDNKSERLKLAETSKLAFETLKAECPKGALQETGKGKLVVAQSDGELRGMQDKAAFINRAACFEKVPSLQSWTGDIKGGLYAQDDLALDTQTYCKVIKQILIQKWHARFCFGETVKSILPQDDGTQIIATDKSEHLSDSVIVCLGNALHPIIKPLGIKLPLYPIQGYSLTLGVTPNSPVVSVTDLKHKMVYANLGEKMRIAGFVDANQKPSRFAERVSLLATKAKQNWPDIADYDGPVKNWANARPMTPSGVPIIRSTKTQGIYLNLGHGSLGYTFATGSAKKIAMMIGHARKNSSFGQRAYYAR